MRTYMQTGKLAEKSCSYQQVRSSMCYSMPPVTNLQWPFLPELTTPGGTFTFRSTTVALSNGASRPQLLRQSVLFFLFFFQI